MLRALIGSVLAVAAWAGRQLDYARPFRPEAHYQQVRLHEGLGLKLRVPLLPRCPLPAGADASGMRV